VSRQEKKRSYNRIQNELCTSEIRSSCVFTMTPNNVALLLFLVLHAAFAETINNAISNAERTGICNFVKVLHFRIESHEAMRADCGSGGHGSPPFSIALFAEDEDTMDLYVEVVQRVASNNFEEDLVCPDDSTSNNDGDFMKSLAAIQSVPVARIDVSAFSGNSGKHVWLLMVMKSAV
jgi:hypothetical protein